MRRLLLVAASIVLLSAECRRAASCQLSEPERATVASIKDAETLELTDGTIVRLIGAKTPQSPLGWHGSEPWPLVAEAGEMTKRLASGAEVELRFGGNRTDRHGYKLAQVYVLRNGTRQWLQQELIKAGLARVYSFSDNRACVEALLIEEAEGGSPSEASGIPGPIARWMRRIPRSSAVCRIAISWWKASWPKPARRMGASISISQRTGEPTSPSQSSPRMCLHSGRRAST